MKPGKDNDLVFLNVFYYHNTNKKENHTALAIILPSSLAGENKFAKLQDWTKFTAIILYVHLEVTGTSVHEATTIQKRVCVA